MSTNPVSYQVYKSRDQIRTQITDLIKEYLELENVDLTKSSFLSFLVEILSTLSSNLLFYQISTYREFFLTKAQLPESIFNLAAFLGYTPTEATQSNVGVLFTIPFGFEDALASFSIPNGFQVTGEGGIIFKTYYSTTVEVTNNSSVVVTIREGNKVYRMPVIIAASEFTFLLPFRNFQTQQQEFQVASDSQAYQFVSFDVAFEGQLSSLVVDVRPPGSTALERYEPVSSLFLMESTTKGYVYRRTDAGVELHFGNGLIGFQPQAGSTVFVSLNLTDGNNGNVISGSITSGQRIYNTNLAGITRIVQYTVTNPSAAFGGEDEESLEETRRNSITSLTALRRTVSENDYINANIIIDDSPIGQNSLPVLKRSDLKVNEIALFSTIYFADELVPTRNATETFTDLFVPRNTIINIDGIDFYTVYDMEIDALNSVAEYTYIMFEIEQIPTLVTSYGSTYDLYADNLIASRSGIASEYKLTVKSTEADVNLAQCTMEIAETGSTYSTTYDVAEEAFVFSFPNNTILPKGKMTYFFTITHPFSGLIAQYSVQFIFRLSLDDFCFSNTVYDSTSAVHIVYDIPVVRKDYYDSINQREFELQVMQQLLTTLTFKDYRMLTDFVNFKFANTTGVMKNMDLNPVTTSAVIDILCDPPLSPSTGDRYLVGKGMGEWETYCGKIAVFDTTSWVFIQPKSDDIVFVTNKNAKYIYSEFGWVLPEFEIPLQIEVDVFKSSTYSGSIGNLAQAVRDALVEAFEDRFGINISLFRSELIDVVQEVDGVDHCTLNKPISNIFFNFNINDLTQEELLEYGPEYVYFTADDITIRVY